MNDLDLSDLGLLEVVVANRVIEADGIVSLELRARSGACLPAFSPGSHLDLHLEGGLIRQYSLLNDSSETERYIVAVLVEPSGRGGSLEVHEKLLIGTNLKIGRPRNNFLLNTDADYTVLMAGGIGITPILSMAHELSRQGRRFELHYCARSEQRAAFVNLLQKSPFAEAVHFHFDDAQSDGRLVPARDIGPPDSMKHMYLCGPSGFMDYIIGSAVALGWSDENIHLERFHALDTDSESGSAFTVIAERSGISVEVPSGQTIAQALSGAGVSVFLSCEQGFCGTCLTPVLDGMPDHRDTVLSDAEKLENSSIAICCSRAQSGTLRLDI